MAVRCKKVILGEENDQPYCDGTSQPSLAFECDFDVPEIRQFVNFLKLTCRKRNWTFLKNTYKRKEGTISKIVVAYGNGDGGFEPQSDVEQLCGPDFKCFWIMISGGWNRYMSQNGSLLIAPPIKFALNDVCQCQTRKRSKTYKTSATSNTMDIQYDYLSTELFSDSYYDQLFEIQKKEEGVLEPKTSTF